jgi:threonine dehydrogenase-like Zn-dependent dehydrogenase
MVRIDIGMASVYVARLAGDSCAIGNIPLMGEARAFWVAVPGRGEIRAQRLPPLPPGELLIRARASAISRGTESLVFRGEVPQSEWSRMRCPFQEGEFPAPLKYGYAVAGIIEDGPAERRGERVFCLHPHQDRFIVPADAVVTVPRDVPDRRATLAANMETAINGLWDAAPGPGDHIAVVGTGVVGALIGALAARLPGAEVELIDIDPSRAAVASALGCRFAAPQQARGEADLVIHASGAPDGLATALALAGFEATVVEMSWYGTRIVPLALGAAFHSRRLTLRSSQVGAVPAGRRARWSRRRRLALALALLRDPVFDRLLSGETEFAALPELMPRLAATPAGVLCHTVRYD